MMQLTVLNADLRQTVRNLEISIEHEEDREQIFLARQLKGRRDNLLLTISALETHLNGPISLQGALCQLRSSRLAGSQEAHCPEM
jgi:hypothetical protein